LLGKAYLTLAGSLAGQDIPLPPGNTFTDSLKNLFFPKKRTDPVKVA